MNLFKVDLVTVPLVAGQSVYDVDPSTINILDLYYSTPVSAGQTIDRILMPISRTDYASYSMKELEGTPTVFWFDRLNSPTITLWQPPSQGDPYSISYYRMARIQDANMGGGEIPNINYRFLEAACADLAARLAEKYAPQLEMNMRAKAKMAWDEAAAEDVEKVTQYIRPVLERYWR